MVRQQTYNLTSSGPSLLLQMNLKKKKTAINKGIRMVKSVRYGNAWYYVQKRYCFFFWSSITDSYRSYDEAKQAYIRTLPENNYEEILGI